MEFLLRDIPDLPRDVLDLNALHAQISEGAAGERADGNFGP